MSADRLFKMPIALSFTAGFIQSAISPTVLVTGMLELQRQGLGQDKGECLPLLPPLLCCVCLTSARQPRSISPLQVILVAQ